MKIKFTEQNKSGVLRNIILGKWYKCEFVRNCGDYQSHIDLRNEIGECSRVHYNAFYYELEK